MRQNWKRDLPGESDKTDNDFSNELEDKWKLGLWENEEDVIPSVKPIEPYIVKPKETKWRIAYNLQITIPELEALNPEIKKGLKEGQEIRVPMVVRQRISETISDTMNQTVSQSVEPVWDSNYNYYRVLPKEGYYRICLLYTSPSPRDS